MTRTFLLLEKMKRRWCICRMSGKKTTIEIVFFLCTPRFWQVTKKSRCTEKQTQKTSLQKRRSAVCIQIPEFHFLQGGIGMKCIGILGADVYFFHCLHTVPPVSVPPQIREQEKRERDCRPVLLCKFTNRLDADSQKNVFFARFAICEKVGFPVQKKKPKISGPYFWGILFQDTELQFFEFVFSGHSVCSTYLSFF